MTNEPLKLVSGYLGVAYFVEMARTHAPTEWESLWWQYAIEPHWAEWAAGQFNEDRTKQQMKQPIVNLEVLAQQVHLLAESNVEMQVAEAYKQITSCLSSPHPGRAVCIYPLDPQNDYVRDKLNGVLGTCVGDNILLQINPLAADWQNWVPYVLAHEYHHTVWGYHYFVVLGKSRMDLLTAMLVDGQADSFARTLYPERNPSWIAALTPIQEAQQWRIAKAYLGSSDETIYKRFMFGEETSGTPACTGYTIGYHIVQAYLRSHPQVGISDLMNLEAESILAESGYDPKQWSEKTA